MLDALHGIIPSGFITFSWRGVDAGEEPWLRYVSFLRGGGAWGGGGFLLEGKTHAKHTGNTQHSLELAFENIFKYVDSNYRNYCGR